MLVEYEESISNVPILIKIVPTINSEKTMNSSIWFFTDNDLSEFTFPIFTITFLSSSDNVDIFVPVLAFIIGDGYSRFTRSNATPKDFAVTELSESILLMFL